MLDISKYTYYIHVMYKTLGNMLTNIFMKKLATNQLKYKCKE